jgi:hypothetical protein
MIDTVLPHNVSTAIPQSVPTGECLALRHFLSLTSVAAVVGSAFQLAMSV